MAGAVVSSTPPPPSQSMDLIFGYNAKFEHEYVYLDIRSDQYRKNTGHNIVEQLKLIWNFSFVDHSQVTIAT